MFDLYILLVDMGIKLYVLSDFEEGDDKMYFIEVTQEDKDILAKYIYKYYPDDFYFLCNKFSWFEDKYRKFGRV